MKRPKSVGRSVLARNGKRGLTVNPGHVPFVSVTTLKRQRHTCPLTELVDKFSKILDFVRSIYPHVTIYAVACAFLGERTDEVGLFPSLSFFSTTESYPVIQKTKSRSLCFVAYQDRQASKGAGRDSRNAKKGEGQARHTDRRRSGRGKAVIHD
jgi:hypothetical protein